MSALIDYLIKIKEAKTFKDEDFKYLKTEIESLEKELATTRSKIPPFSLGDIVYYAHSLGCKCFAEVVECKVSMIQQVSNGRWKIRISVPSYHGVFDSYIDELEKKGCSTDKTKIIEIVNKNNSKIKNCD